MNESNSANNEHKSHESATEHHDAHAPEGAHAASHEIPKEKTFEHLLGELGDHHELNMGFFHADVLPAMFIDEGSFHFYPNSHSIAESGKYELFHTQERSLKKFNGHIVKMVDGKPQKVAFDLSITNLVVYEWMAMLVMLILFRVAVNGYKKGAKGVPTGLVANAIESLVIYVRDEVVRPNLGSDRLTRQLLPYFLSIFFFIMLLNYIGLLPGFHAATGAVGVTAALAITAFFVTNIVAIKEAGIGAWFHHLLGGAPIYMAPIMVPVEVLGLFTKPFALTVRLFANMTAGHVVLVSLIGLIFFFKSIFVAPISVGFSVFIYFLETLVCILQAYIFTMLTAVFVGLALGDHKGDDAHHAHH